MMTLCRLVPAATINPKKFAFFKTPLCFLAFYYLDLLSFEIPSLMTGFHPVEIQKVDFLLKGRKYFWSTTTDESSMNEFQVLARYGEQFFKLEPQ